VGFSRPMNNVTYADTSNPPLAGLVRN